MSIGKNIQKHRKAKKITQKTLGEMIGKSEISVRKYEADNPVPSLEVIGEIANALNVHIDEIVEDENPIRRTEKEISKVRLILLDLTESRIEQDYIYESLISEAVDDENNEELKVKLEAAERELNKIDNFILDTERNLEYLEEKLKKLKSEASTYEVFGDFYTDSAERKRGENRLKELKSIRDENRLRELNAIRDENHKNKLLKIYEKLNRTGKEEAIKRVDELTQIQKYTKDETIVINYDEAD